MEKTTPTTFIACSIWYGYSHLSNRHGGWNKRGGGVKAAKSIIMEMGINMEVGINGQVGIFWKILVHNCNKQGVEGGKNLRNQ